MINSIALIIRFMGIDYYFVRAQYDWPELSENPTYPVTWLSQFYSIIDIPQVTIDYSSIISTWFLFALNLKWKCTQKDVLRKPASFKLSCLKFYSFVVNSTEDAISQTLSVFFIVPFLTNWLGLHDALMSRYLSIKTYKRSWTQGCLSVC